MRPNPFVRGSITAGGEFVGRRIALQRIEYLTESVRSGHGHIPVCFLAPAGYGKTTLLKRSANLLREKSWICGYAEAASDTTTAVQDLLTDIRRSAPSYGAANRFLKHIGGLGVTAGFASVSFNLKDDRGQTSYSNLLELLERLVKLAEREGAGLAILIDEAQVLSSWDIHSIMRAVKQLDTHPVALIFSSLPSLPEWVSAGLQSEVWIDYSRLSAFNVVESRSVLATPLKAVGGRFDQESLTRLVRFAKGHPLVLQMLGFNAWTLAQEGAGDDSNIIIRRHHAEAAITETTAQLQLSQYRPTWLRCTPPQREMLSALASSPDNSMLVTDLLERTPYRDEVDVFATYTSLIGKGIISESVKPVGRETAQIVLPGFEQFIGRIQPFRSGQI